MTRYFRDQSVSASHSLHSRQLNLMIIKKKNQNFVCINMYVICVTYKYMKRCVMCTCVIHMSMCFCTCIHAIMHS